MRRMLDPKEVGGGTGSARHCYSVDVDGQFIYIVNTEKNYNFTIGKKKRVSDFMTNPDYEELHAGGSKSFSDYWFYPAIGTYKATKTSALVIVNYLGIYDNNTCVVQGTSLDSSNTSVSVSIKLSNISIVKLY